ncbi:MAG: Nif3-like dinuclear metal center hexameric protein, partial [Candidatus Hermodarchaeota archaeon]
YSFNKNLLNKLALLSKYPIIVYVLNSSFIGVEGGISDTIMDLLYLELDRPFNIKNKNGNTIPIGRICTPKNYFNDENLFKFGDLLKRIKTNLELKKISYVGDLNKEVHKICIIGGEFPEFKYLNKIIESYCDCYISCKINYDFSIYAREIGLNLIEIPNYNCEIKAMKKLCNFLSLEFSNDEIFLYNPFNPIQIY